jgi:pyrroline-5-carboxylate reductase
MRLGFIGTGEITSSIVTGLSSSGVTDHSIWLSPRNSVIADGLARDFPGISVASSNQGVLDHCDTIVIAVRPSVVQGVVSELRFRPSHQVISLVSSLSLQRLSELVALAERIARAVPLPSAAHRMSPTGIYPAESFAVEVFAAVGEVFPAENESQFDAICATTATIAFDFALKETLASWLEQHGVPARQAKDYVARLFLGVATGVVETSGRSLESLAASHATAGGINEQFLKHLVNDGLLSRVSEGLDAILQRIAGKSRNLLSGQH